MNPSSGLKSNRFETHTNRATDNELKKLKVYVDIARKNVDFKALDHKKWERYVLKVLKEGRLSEEEANEVKGFWPNSTSCASWPNSNLLKGRPTTIAASTHQRGDGR